MEQTNGRRWLFKWKVNLFLLFLCTIIYIVAYCMSKKRNLSKKVRGKVERNFIAAGTLSIKIIFE